MDEVKLVAVDDAGRWERAALSSGQPVTVFHTYSWLSLASRMTDTAFTPLVITTNGADVGIVPWLTRRRGPISTVNWVPFPYVGPLIPTELLPATLSRLVQRSRRHGVIQCQLCFPPGASVDPATLWKHGFAVRTDQTYRVDTRLPEDELWAAVAARTRTAIRAAERIGVVVESSTDTTILGEAVSTAFKARNLKSGYTSSEFPPSIENLSALGLRTRLTVASVDGAAAGSLASFMHGDSALIWQGGVLPEFRATNANAALYWDSIKWAHHEGATSLDLVGIPDEGIGKFKRKFGGNLVDYTVAVRSSFRWKALACAQSVKTYVKPSLSK
jgi:hypothetical protein